ncbi:MAG: hypothetical protein ABH873_10140 [Candidatus Firestonebacteria bacterium]
MKIDFKNIKAKELAGLISEELRKEDIDTTLVGGACVTIYSRNKYVSADFDIFLYKEIIILYNIERYRV